MCVCGVCVCVRIREKWMLNKKKKKTGTKHHFSHTTTLTKAFSYTCASSCSALSYFFSCFFVFFLFFCWCIESATGKVFFLSLWCSFFFLYLLFCPLLFVVWIVELHNCIEGLYLSFCVYDRILLKGVENERAKRLVREAREIYPRHLLYTLRICIHKSYRWLCSHIAYSQWSAMLHTHTHMYGICWDCCIVTYNRKYWSIPLPCSRQKSNKYRRTPTAYHDTDTSFCFLIVNPFLRWSNGAQLGAKLCSYI